MKTKHGCLALTNEDVEQRDMLSTQATLHQGGRDSPVQFGHIAEIRNQDMAP